MISRISRLLLLCIMGTTLCNAKDFEGELRNRARSLTGTNVVFDYIGWVTDQAQSAPVIKTRRSNNHWNLDIEFCTPIIKALEKVALTTSEKKRLVTMSDKLVDLYSNGPVDQQALIDLKAWQARVHHYAGNVQDEDLTMFLPTTTLPAAHPHQPVIEIAPETQGAINELQTIYLHFVKEMVVVDKKYAPRKRHYEQDVAQTTAKYGARVQRTLRRLAGQLTTIGTQEVQVFEETLQAELWALRHSARRLLRLYPKIDAAAANATRVFVHRIRDLQQDILDSLNLGT